MRCPRCQHENEASAKFCEECAAPLVRGCAKCGRSLSPTAKFCPECAHPTGPSATSPPAQRFDSPESYTPKHLAEKILTSKSALEGERKQVTVLFADLKGSMELLADRDPEEARKLLDPVLERMMEAVHRYEGTVNQVMGDGIMALFGAPVAHEDHAVRACYAALDVQAALHRYAEEVRRTHGVDVQVRVGLNSGEVVVRAIGSDLRMDYSAVGQTTHLAARMEQLARPGVTLLTADTLRLAEGYVEVKPLGPVPLKGLVDPIEVYELAGLGLVRSRLGAAAARGLTRFVGRDAELEQIRQAIGRAAAGHGQVVALVGEPGVGKSRLVWEVTHSHRTHGWLIVPTNSVSYGKATPYLPVIDLFKGYVKIQDQDDPRAVREKVTGKLLTLDEALKPTVPAFLALLDVPVDDAAWSALDPPQRRQRTLEAVKRLLLRESQVQPLLVVFEDLHWIDTETQAFLDSLVDSLPTARMLLLVNYRPEYAHRWGSKTYYTQLRLDPLPPESAEALLDALVGSDPALRPLKHLLIERTEGNPFFLEESVRTLIETKVLSGERGAYLVATELPSILVPATVQAVLAARIDRLPSDEKRLLQTASVIGKEVAFSLLRAVADLPEEACRRDLAHLQAAEFLYETSLFPDVEYTFKHALTQEVAYGSLLQDHRRALHARVVEAIERLSGDRQNEHIERLAHHALRSQMWDKASAYLQRAGARAAERSAHRAAVDYLELALVALGHLPDTRETLARALDVRFDLHASLFPLAEYARMRDHMEAAEQIAVALGDRDRLARVLSLLCPALRLANETRRSGEVGRRALAIAEEVGDQRLMEETSFWLGQTHATLGDHRGAEPFYRRNITPLPVNLTPEAARALPLFASNARAWLATSLTQLGRFDEGLTLGADALRVAQALDDKFRLIIAHSHLGWLHLHRGTLTDSVRHLEQAVALGRSWDISDTARGSAIGLATAYAHLGRIEEALEHIGPRLGYFSPLRCGEIYFLAGQREKALEAAAQALTRSQQTEEQGLEGWALYLLATIRANGDLREWDQGEEHFRAALTRAEELSMRPLVAHCHLGLGKLYGRTGDGAKAEEHLTTTRAMYREMDMRFWLAKAEAACAGGDP